MSKNHARPGRSLARTLKTAALLALCAGVMQPAASAQPVAPATTRFSPAVPARQTGALAQQMDVTSIVMRTSASVPGDAHVTLAQVATITGPEANTLGAIIVLEAPQAPSGTAGAIIVDRERVEKALAKANVNWAQTLLRGRATSVLIEAASETATEDPPHAPPTAGTPAFTPPPTSPTSPPTTPTPALALPDPAQSPSLQPLVPSQTAPGTLRALIESQIASELGVSTGDVQVSYEGASANGPPWLERPLPPDSRVRVTVSGFGISGRTPVRVEAFSGDRVVLDQSAQTLVRVRVLVPVAAKALLREAAITEQDLKLDERWQPAGQAPPPTTESLLGGILRRRIEAGRPVAPADVTTPVVIRRGEEVWVECISGVLVVKARARALENARDGELVRLAIDKSKQTLTARMNGRGRAVVQLDATTIDTQDNTAQASARSPTP